MAIAFRKAAVLGATGPTGRSLVRELLGRGVAVRVVSRSEANLAASFAQMPVERIPADLLDGAATRRVVEGCDLVFDCIGLPAARMADHPRSASNIGRAIRHTGARCVHISSYWAYIPIQRTPVSEIHPRTGGPLPVRLRRQAEEILREAGAAIVNLPDFYGPEVHTSTLQRALAEAVAGKTIHWIGSPETAREYVFVPDAMKAVTELAFCEQAYGERWIVPGPSPITFRRVMEIAASSLGRQSKIRAAGPLALRILSLFVSELRSFLPLVPAYVAPISYDGSKIRALLGDVPTTPYEVAIPRTLEWLAAQAGRASEQSAV